MAQEESYYLIDYSKSTPKSGDGDFHYEIEKMVQLTKGEAKKRNSTLSSMNADVRYVRTHDLQMEIAPEIMKAQKLKKEAGEDITWMGEWEEDDSCDKKKCDKQKCEKKKCKKKGCRKKKG